jgi:hypothetical protein
MDEVFIQVAFVSREGDVTTRFEPRLLGVFPIPSGKVDELTQGITDILTKFSQETE